VESEAGEAGEEGRFTGLKVPHPFFPFSDCASSLVVGMFFEGGALALGAPILWFRAAGRLGLVTGVVLFVTCTRWLRVLFPFIAVV